MFKRFLGVLLAIIATAVPLIAETVKGSAETPDGEFKWEIVLAPTGEENVYSCRVKVTKTATSEVVFAPAVTFETGRQAVATSSGEYTSKLTINANAATGNAVVDLEIRKGTIDLIGARTSMTLK